MRITIDIARQGSQERPYGPNVFDLTIKLESGMGLSLDESVYDRWARKVIDWSDEPKWYDWRLVERQQLNEQTYRYRVEQPYDD